MTKRERRIQRFIESCIAKWQPRLGLANWEIRLRIGGLQEGEHVMECHHSPQYERATIRVAEWVLRRENPENDGLPVTNHVIERSIIHELLHCATRDLREQLDLISGYLYPQHEQTFVAAHERAEEQLVDRLATALLREWPA